MHEPDFHLLAPPPLAGLAGGKHGDELGLAGWPVHRSLHEIGAVMTHVGKSLIRAAKEAAAIARGEPNYHGGKRQTEVPTLVATSPASLSDIPSW